MYRVQAINTRRLALLNRVAYFPSNLPARKDPLLVKCFNAEEYFTPFRPAFIMLGTSS
jgi:hypothetical protein